MFSRILSPRINSLLPITFDKSAVPPLVVPSPDPNSPYISPSQLLPRAPESAEAVKLSVDLIKSRRFERPKFAGE